MILNSRKNKGIKRFQHGLSLLELMISMTLGIFLLVGLVTSFISTKNTEKFRNAVSEMDANASLIFDIMRKTITHAGYVSINPVVQGTSAFYTVKDVPILSATCRNGNQRDLLGSMKSIRPTKDTSTRDSLAVTYLADNPCKKGKLSCSHISDTSPQALVYYDCTGGGMTRDSDTVACSTDSEVGMHNPADAIIYSSFWLLLNKSSPNNRTLYCSGTRGGTQPIANNVEAIQYLYGVKENNDNVTFKPANTVSKESNWGKVRSVQVAMLLRSSVKHILHEDSKKIDYDVLDVKVKIPKTDRKRLYRIYTSTINLENMK